MKKIYLTKEEYDKKIFEYGRVGKGYRAKPMSLEIKEKENEMNNVQEIRKELENEFGTNLEELKKSDDYEKKSNFLDEFVKKYDESTKKTINLENQIIMK